MRLAIQETLYDCLEVAPDASEAALDAAFARLSAALTDGSLAVYGLADDATCAAALAELIDAYKTLRDPTSRRAYDERALHRSAISRPPHLRAVPDLDAPRCAARAADEPPPITAQVVAGAASLIEPIDAAEVPAEPEVPQGGDARSPTLAVQGLLFGEQAIEEAAPPEVEEAHVAAPAAPPAPPAVPLPLLGEDTTFTGPLLRQIREAKGLCLRAIAERTKVSLPYLESIERETIERLPGRVYLRGFLTVYARELRLDPRQVCESYLLRCPTLP